MFCLYQPFNTYCFLRGCFGEGSHMQKITFATYNVAQEWCLIFHFIIFLSISCLLFSVITTLCNTNDKAEVIFLSGSYKSSHLITMIALHLDATFAAYNIWEEFATCILILQTQNSFLEDQMPMDIFLIVVLFINHLCRMGQGGYGSFALSGGCNAISVR